MTLEIFSNNANTQLAAGISSFATTILLTTGTGALFPNPSAGEFFTLTLNDALTGDLYEICNCTARTGDSCTVTRGQEGTTARAWLLGDFAYNAWTADSIVKNSQGRFLGIQKFSTAGTFTYTPTIGTNVVLVRVCGAGGGGGGPAATGASQAALSAGGMSGSHGEGRYTSAFAGVTVTVGAAGTGTFNGPGGDGGDSSFGALLVAPGGTGGGLTPPGTPPLDAGGTTNTTASGGTIYNAAGQPGGLGVAQNFTSQGVGGNGASSPFGNGGVGTTSGVGGDAGGNGAGGGGTYLPQSTGAGTGGAGSAGIVIVMEFS